MPTDTNTPLDNLDINNIDQINSRITELKQRQAEIEAVLGHLNSWLPQANTSDSTSNIDIQTYIATLSIERVQNNLTLTDLSELQHQYYLANPTEAQTESSPNNDANTSNSSSNSFWEGL
jgi:hypothetical protein